MVYKGSEGLDKVGIDQSQSRNGEELVRSIGSLHAWRQRGGWVGSEGIGSFQG
jgi:hypothetical protein